MSILTTIFGDPHKRYVKKLQPLVNKINAFEAEIVKLSDEELRGKTEEFKKRLGIITSASPLPPPLTPPLAGGENRAGSPPFSAKGGSLEGGQGGGRGGLASLDDLLPEAFAVVREAAKRTLGQRHYDVQLMGGIVLHRGAIAEMRTGEGKTLVSTLPAYLNALAGKGVHLVTVNDYLTRRDAVWMGRVYHALGLSVGCITHESAYVYDPGHKNIEHDETTTTASPLPPPLTPPLAGGENLVSSPPFQGGDRGGSVAVFKVEHECLRPVPRREAYRADILYGTNNEFGFDYLRDNMVSAPEDKVQSRHYDRDPDDISSLNQGSGQGHFFAIVDEVDSILIDEARTPLIISAPAEESEDLYYKFADLVARLKENEDYNIDEKMRASTLNDQGINKLEQWLGVKNLYAEGGLNLVRHAEQSLRAHALYHRDKDYVVKDGEIIIVDEFTGRLMPGRRWSEGLHQAVEAKERVKIERESQTLATVTFQNYFRMYKKLAGMTGTAASESEEFHKIYGLDVVMVPTNKPMVRKDLTDRVYRSEMGKFQAVVQEIKKRHQAGQPVLVGTISIEKNEILSELLERAGVPHKLLNAKNHEKEAEIIAQAGRKGGVTVATNMAGRGVDIILGGNPADPKESEEVRVLGGLSVLGTERHDSRRIDNQLRGRSGRQGDPGVSQFYVSLEDDLMRIFAGDRIKALMGKFQIPEDMPIESKIVSRSIESAQNKVEQHNFDIRKHLLEYDDVLNKHREAIYRRRDDMLVASDSSLRDGVPSLRDGVLKMIENEIEQVVLFHTPENGSREDWNIEEILEVLRTIFPLPEQTREKIEDLRAGNGSKLEDAEASSKIVETLMEAARVAYVNQEQQLSKQSGDEQIMRKVEQSLILRAIDALWVEHLDAIEHLRRGIGLRAYGQREPLVEYKKSAYQMFQELQHLIDKQVVYSIYKVGVSTQAAPSLLQRQGMQMSGAAKTMSKGNAIDGEVVSASTATASTIPKIGRNDPCPCGAKRPDGSAIKYKNCHGR